MKEAFPYVYFPMLLRFYDTDGDPSTIGTTIEPLMIVAPQAISASIDADYVVVSGSVHLVKFNIDDYVNKITETVIVNYFNGASDEDNAHNLISKDNDGLLDVSILPEDAQGGYSYEILGDGINFAYINSKNQIVFTGASGQTPILVRIYSVFNPEIEVFVVFYSQNLLTKLEFDHSHQ